MQQLLGWQCVLDLLRAAARPLNPTRVRRNGQVAGSHLVCTVDEEWFSAVHVAIEARSGQAVVATAHALRVCAGERVDTAAAVDSLEAAADSIDECIAILERMGERCDPYIYNERVRVFMSGWTSDAMPAEGLAYEGVPLIDARGAASSASAVVEPTSTWRTEAYFGETGVSDRTTR